MTTVADLVTRWRLKLDDTVETYLWSNDELVGYLNRIVNNLCREAPLIVDSTTASICTVSITSGDTTLSVSDRILFCKRAKISSQTSPLTTVSVEWMDSHVADWENSPAGEPMYLITRGIGTNTYRIYPEADDSYTLGLTVSRLPLTDLDWDTDQSNSPEIPAKYHDLLDNGIYWLAYNKQDADTADRTAARDFLALWEMDKERIIRSVAYQDHDQEAVIPLFGMV